MQTPKPSQHPATPFTILRVSEEDYRKTLTAIGTDFERWTLAQAARELNPTRFCEYEDCDQQPEAGSPLCEAHNRLNAEEEARHCCEYHASGGNVAECCGTNAAREAYLEPSRTLSEAAELAKRMQTPQPITTAQHTHGSWITDKTHSHEWEGITVWANDVVIAHVVEDQHNECAANARLIAAAPEMLAVLTRAADNLALAHDAGCSDQRGLSVDLCTCPLATNWRSARAAIAKAVNS